MRQMIDKTNFVLVCLYLVSQAYTIPLVAIGPWPIWPMLSDVISGAMIVLFVLHLRFEKQVSVQNRKVWNFASFLFACCFLSVIGEIEFPAKAASSDPKHLIYVALYQMYRFGQFLVVFHVAANLRLDSKRYRSVKALTLATFLVIVGGVVCTSMAILPTSAVAPGLPKSLLVAGPWAFYSGGTVDQGVGFVSYNHAYTAIQLMLAAGLALHFRPISNRLRATIYLLLLGGTLLSRSRAGFLCAVLFVLFYEGRKHLSREALIIVIPLIILALLGTLRLFQNQGSDDNILSRQLDAGSSYKADGLSGRTDIWSDTIHELDASAWRWAVGNGFGSALDSGGEAHMLFLTVTLETGFAGLTVFIIVFSRLLKFLRSRGDSGKAMFWTTLILLVTSLTQETFYPVIAFGHFLGFYFLAVALSLNRFVPAREHVVAVNKVSTEILPGTHTACRVSG